MVPSISYMENNCNLITYRTEQNNDNILTL